MARIVLLDDDEDLLDALSDLVRYAGSTCVTVRSLGEMMARREEVLGCDLAVLDVNLGPGEPTGLDAFAWLRTEQFGGRVVFLTGHAAGHPFVERAGQLSGTAVHQKPIGLTELRGWMGS